MKIERFELRFHGAPCGIGEHVVNETTTEAKKAAQWLRDMSAIDAREHRVTAIAVNGTEYPCELERGQGPLGVLTDDGLFEPVE